MFATRLYIFPLNYIAILIFSQDGTRFSGDFSDEEIPDPIPNSEVKLVSADGTCPVRGRESRSLPVFFVSLRGALCP